MELGYDPRQRFLRLVPDGDGVIYGVQADGRLLWYRHIGWSAGEPNAWANASEGRVIGRSGWNQFRALLATEDGQLFGFRPRGEVVWHR